MTTRSPFCECGCGNLTTVSNKTDYASGRITGQPSRFKRGHNLQNHMRTGGRHVVAGKGVYIWAPDHPRATNRGYVLEHILIASQALGKPVMLPAEIHHLNEDPTDNRATNLVVCQDHEYHLLLHVRRRALVACGKPNWRKCQFCKTWDDPTNMRPKARLNTPARTLMFYHHACETAYRRQRYALRHQKEIP